MSPTDPVLAHLISRLEADVRFLTDQGHISQADSQTVLGVFSRAGSGSVANLSANFGGVSLGVRDAPGMPAPYGAPPAPAAYSPPPAPPASYSAPPAPYSPNAPPVPYSPAPTPYNANSQGSFNTPAPAFPGGPPAPAYGTPSPAPSSALKRPVPPPPPVSSEPQCKALWDYNLDGKLGGDLTFRSGDVITLVKEDNPDWWTGRLNGREGMFPSNHVEKLPPSAPGYNPSYGYDEKQQQYAPPAGAPAAYQQGPAQPATEEEKKKGKFGKYGSMMAGSAAGGLGFGAGAAVGSGLINAIF